MSRRVAPVFLSLIACLAGGLAPRAAAATYNIDFDTALFVVDNFLSTTGLGTVLKGSDNDSNGILEEDQLGMLAAILAGGSPVACLNQAMVTTIQNGYGQNLVAVQQELVVNVSGVGTVDIINSLQSSDPQLANALLNVLTGFMTIADTSTIDFVNAIGDAIIAKQLTGTPQENQIPSVQNQINFTAAAFATYGNAPSEPNYLGPAGDVDGDGQTNLAEYLDGAIRKSREQWLQDCCITPSLRITGFSGGGLKVTGLSETFNVEVTGAVGPVTYQWRKGTTSSSTLLGSQQSYTIPFLNVSNSGTYFCIVSDGVTTRTSAIATLSVVYVPIIITSNPVGGTKPPGRSHTFSVTVQGGQPGPYVYTWRRNGIVVGPNAPTYTINSITAADAGSYRCTVTSNGGGDAVQSSAAVLNVQNVPFLVTEEPVNADRYLGDLHTFTVAAQGGSGQFNYVWRKDGNVLSVPNLPTLTLGPLTASDAGLYECTITDANNSANTFTTNSARLRVEQPIQITLQPVGATVNVGDPISFTVAATGGYQPLRYQWRYFSVDIPGQTNPTYSATALGGFSGNFSCRVTDQVGGFVLSDPAVLVVIPKVTFLAQPLGGNYYPGGQHTFSVTIGAGVGALNYVWRKDGVDLGVPSASSLTINNLSPSDSGAYTCYVEAELAAPAESTVAQLQVANYPEITQQPQGAIVMTGSSYTFSVAVSGGIPPLQYQWRRNGSNINGAISPSYTLTGITLSQGGSYSCRITDGLGTVLTSAGAALSVFEPISFPVQPENARAYIGGNATFTAQAAGGIGVLNYEWRKNNQPIAGAPNSATYTVTGVTNGSAGSYSVRAYDNINNSGISNAVQLEVAPLPEITTQPVGGERFPGESIVLTVGVTGGFTPYSYQWFRNDVPVPDSNTASLSVISLDENSAGDYRCAVQDALGTVRTSNTATVTLAQSLTILSQPVGADKYTGEFHAFHVTVEGGSGIYTYSWRRDGQVIAGATGPLLTLNNLTPADDGTYTCLVRDELEAGVQTLPAVLRVRDHLSITVQPQSAVVAVGAPYSFVVETSGGFEPISYQWRKGGLNLPGATQSTYDIALAGPADAGAYSCIIKDSRLDQLVSSTAFLSVGDGIDIVQQPQSANLYVGTAHTLTIVAQGGSGTLHYEWRRNGVSTGLPDQPFIHFPSLTLSDAGAYSCLVSDEDGVEVLSETAILRVGQPLVVTQQPAGGRAYAGASFGFFMGVSGGFPPLQYQWRLNGNDIPGATSAIFNTGPLVPVESVAYSCSVRDDIGNEILSDIALLQVRDRISFSIHPSSSDNYAGASPVLFVVAQGGFSPLNYTWRLNGEAIGAQDSPALFIANGTPEQSGQYDCLVSDDFGDSAASNAATVNFFDRLTLLEPLADAALVLGQSFTLAPSFKGGIPPLSFLWRKNGAPFASQSAPGLLFENAAFSDAAAYTLTISDAGNESITAGPASVTVLGITEQPVGVAKAPGDDHTFTIAAQGGKGTIHYDWHFEGVSLGAPDAPSLTLSKLDFENEGIYTCVVSDDGGAAVTSEEAILQVSVSPIVFTEQPASAHKYVGESHTLSIAFEGGIAPVSMQWTKNTGSGFVAVPGATGPTLEFSSLTLQDRGQYRCEVSSADLFRVPSAPATLVVAAPLGISVQPQPLNLYQGQSGELSVEISGGLAPITYLWQRNGEDIPGANARSLIITANNALAGGEYVCVVADRRSIVASNKVLVRVGAPIQISTLPRTVFRYAGESESLSISITGGVGEISYEWLKNGESFATQPELSLGPLRVEDSGAYVCIIRDAIATINSGVLLNLTVVPLPEEGEIAEGEGAPATGDHSADQDGNGAISLSELLRVIQLFSLNALHCEAGTEDGYAPGPGDTGSCRPHSSDYNPQDWKISLSELLRLIQFYSTGGYYACPGEETEDGYCPLGG